MIRYHGLQDHRDTLPLLVVDLGYSTHQRSCGLVSSRTEPCELGFGEAIDAAVAFIHAAGSCVIALEAVLSTYHLPNGNPAIRGSFEKGRGWYHGPGVSTLVAALRFLEQVRKKTGGEADIYLAESMLSYKKQRTRHMDDALRILDAFWEKPMETLPDETEPAAEWINGIPSVRCFHDKA